uniref:Skp1-related protein n=1 Tax=Ascaris lumbricoides TaxID=6252 RepID=A0A0M3IF04_ASCLU
MIRLKSSDNEIFEVDRDVIKMSTTIYTMLQGPEMDFGDSSQQERTSELVPVDGVESPEMDFGDSNEQERTSELIPVDGVESSILRKVLEWCEHHKGDPVASQETDNVSEGIDDSWDVEFLNVDKEILFKTILVLEWCEHHKGDPVASQETDNVSEGIEDSWDVEFLNVDKEILFKTILAANELGIEGLLNATCKVMATMIKGKSPEEIERILTLEDQFTPEQEEQ